MSTHIPSTYGASSHVAKRGQIRGGGGGEREGERGRERGEVHLGMKIQTPGAIDGVKFLCMLVGV